MFHMTNFLDCTHSCNIPFNIRTFIHSKIQIQNKFKMAEETSAALVLVLNELIDSDDEKPKRGRTRGWVQRRARG